MSAPLRSRKQVQASVDGDFIPDRFDPDLNLQHIPAYWIDGAAAPRGDLLVALDLPPGFASGQQGTLFLTVANVGTVPTTGTTTVTITLPAALSFVSGGAPRWNCGLAGGSSVVCTSATRFAPSAGQRLGLTLLGTTTVRQTLTVVATLSNPGDAISANNSSSSQVVLIPLSTTTTTTTTSTTVRATTTTTTTTTPTTTLPRSTLYFPRLVQIKVRGIGAEIANVLRGCRRRSHARHAGADFLGAGEAVFPRRGSTTEVAATGAGIAIHSVMAPSPINL